MKKTDSTKIRLRRDLRRLFRSMDFVSQHPALLKNGREAKRMAEIYQQLGRAWEFLALQCGHWDGFRKMREGKRACKICGTLEGVEEPWMLLPRRGRKTVGHRAEPTSAETLPNKKKATVLDDAIEFHGAKLRVIVQNAYRSKLFEKMDATIAADRMVRIEESGVEISFDTHMIRLRL